MKMMIVIPGILSTMAVIAFSQSARVDKFHVSTPPLANTEMEKKIIAELDDMEKSHQTYLSVPMQDGKVLRLLAEVADAKNVVEIGTSTGYSGLWFCLALQRTGGHLTTFEIDHTRASEARQHFKQAGVDKLVTVVEGDAHEQVTKLKGPIDLAFIDADKEGYVDYLNKILPLVRPGGVILAHNVEMVPEYVKTVTTNANLETIFYMEGNGLAVTLKKR
ncbi:MAG TPA: O-methyltransferase [Terriglobia bacterium]|nr:O-methyltransferase [Terriglobia bacterium]